PHRPQRRRRESRRLANKLADRRSRGGNRDWFEAVGDLDGNLVEAFDERNRDECGEDQREERRRREEGRGPFGAAIDQSVHGSRAWSQSSASAGGACSFR